MAKAPFALASRQHAKWHAEAVRLRGERDSLERIFESARTALHRKSAELYQAEAEACRWEAASKVTRIGRTA